MTSEDDDYELFLDRKDEKLYGKLHSASWDLNFAAQHGSFIQKRGWKAKPWGRGSTYLQQSAFVTAMIISYGRAFGGSNKLSEFPKKLLDTYSSEEMKLHKSIITLRNKVYAHSDSESYSVRPWKSNFHSDIESFPIFEFDLTDTTVLIDMARIMMKAIRSEMQQIKSKYE